MHETLSTMLETFLPLCSQVHSIFVPQAYERELGKDLAVTQFTQIHTF